MISLPKPRDCFSCYSMMFITPTHNGRAKIATCCTNIEKESNYKVVDNDIIQSWNSKEFMYQRYLSLSFDWSYCYGNDCMPFRLKSEFKDLENRSEVQTAIREKKYPCHIALKWFG